MSPPPQVIWTRKRMFGLCSSPNLTKFSTPSSGNWIGDITNTSTSPAFRAFLAWFLSSGQLPVLEGLGGTEPLKPHHLVALDFGRLGQLAQGIWYEPHTTV